MIGTISVEDKYAQPDVIECWQKLSRQGLQKAEQEMITRHLPPTGHLLDVGCGTGRAVMALSQAGYRVTGVDLSLPMLAAGRNLSDEAQLSGANVLALPFVDGAFEAALMFFGALQHIPHHHQRRRALAEMARVVQAGGRLILGLDNLAPALICYGYWLKEKLRSPTDSTTTTLSSIGTRADAILWGREGRQVNPLVWHLRGLARTLRWRTWPGIVDLGRRLNPLSNGTAPGDLQVAQFSLQTTPGRVYYHVYRADELIQDAVQAGWHLLGHYCGTELSEEKVYPPAIRRRDKQQFFAFEKLTVD